MKIVINTVFGGFSLSDVALCLYASKKSITLYPTSDEYHTTYFTVPEGEQFKWSDSMSREERIAVSSQINEQILYSGNIPRDDTALVQVVQELGAAADGEYSVLKIVDIPDEIDWYIVEYDGKEHVAETHKTWS
jgi:hypothetical protein